MSWWSSARSTHLLAVTAAAVVRMNSVVYADSGLLLMAETPLIICRCSTFCSPWHFFFSMKWELQAKVGCVSSYHVKQFFLPVNIQNNQCPCRIFNPTSERERYTNLRSVVTKLRHQRYYIHTLFRSKQSRQCNAIYQVYIYIYAIVLDVQASRTLWLHVFSPMCGNKK